MENYLYLESEGDKLKFVVTLPSGAVEQGIIDVNVEGPLTRQSFSRFKSEILKRAAEKGLTLHEPKILSYEDWKIKAFKSIVENPNNHYGVLTKLLNQLAIQQIPFTEKSVDFQTH